VTKRNLFPLIHFFEGKKRKKKLFSHLYIPNKRLVMIANLSLSLSLSRPKEIKLNSSSTFLVKELTEESADMIGQKVQFLL
jgi:hypothetical protein